MSSIVPRIRRSELTACIQAVSSEASSASASIDASTTSTLASRLSWSSLCVSRRYSSSFSASSA
jgi:hypothetical protein